MNSIFKKMQKKMSSDCYNFNEVDHWSDIRMKLCLLPPMYLCVLRFCRAMTDSIFVFGATATVLLTKCDTVVSCEMRITTCSVWKMEIIVFHHGTRCARSRTSKHVKFKLHFTFADHFGRVVQHSDNAYCF